LKNAMQLKGIIKNMAAKTGIKANALLQNYMLERENGVREKTGSGLNI